MAKPRLFIPVIQHFGVRYVLRTGMLEKLSEFVDPVIGVSWHDPDLEKDYKKAGAEVVEIPPFEYGTDFSRIKDRVNAWHREFRKTPTTKLKARSEFQRLNTKEKVKKLVYGADDAVRLMLPGGLERMFADYNHLLWKNTNAADIETVLLKIKPDAYLSLTPFINREEPLLKAAERNKIASYASILSFDNLTSRNWMPVKFDHYLVWNKYNVGQLLRGYPDVKAGDVTISGAPQFDFYYDDDYLWDEKDWRKRLGIPAGRPVILFGGGTAQLIPNEPVWLEQLDEDITSGRITGNPVVLFRRHPGDIKERWTPVLAKARNVVSDEPWQAKESGGHINITRLDIEKLTSSLKHSAVHINTCSTMTVDGATFDRPQIGPAYDADPQKKFDRTLRELYLREHFQPITNSGGLHLVYDRDDLNQAIADAMERPQERSEGRKKIVSEICTYADGKSSQRVVDTLKELMVGRVEVRSSKRLLPELNSAKPRVLIPVIQHFAVRYLLRTGMLEEMTRFAQPIAAISWDDPTLIRELNRIGVECVPLPPFRFGSDFRVTRERINSWHREFRKTSTLPIDRRRENSLLSTRDMISVNARRIIQDTRLILPGELERLLVMNERLLWSDTNAYEYESILKSTRADVVFSITPYTNREEPLLRAAKKNNLTCYTAILSFDNITTRTWLPITFDHYLLWNKYNASELVRAYPDADPNEITVTGPPQFDFYWDKSYVWDEKDWRKAHGIPASRPVILFGGGSHLVVPHEELWLRELDEEISQGNIPGNPIILFRRHPGDIAERWTDILANAKNVVLDEPWQAKENNGLVNITRRDIEDLTSTLYHANVHINASSTLTVDGAIFDRPQIGPAYDADRRKKFDRVLKDLYIREHYLPITNSGGLDVVYSREQLVGAVNTAFDDPAARAEGRKKLVSEICTFADGKSSQRVVTKLKDLLS